MGFIFTCKIESRTVVGRSSDAIKPCCIINTPSKSQSFKGYQSLIVVGGNYRSEVFIISRTEKTIRRIRSKDHFSIFSNIIQSRAQNCVVLRANNSIITSMWMDSQYSNLRPFYSKIFNQAVINSVDFFIDSLPGYVFHHIFYRNMIGKKPYTKTFGHKEHQAIPFKFLRQIIGVAWKVKAL